MTVKESLAVLEVAATATPEEIRRAYRGLARVWHPDRFHNDPELLRKAQDKLKQINAAYDTLKSAAFAAGHAPTPPPAPKKQPAPAPRPEPVRSQTPNPKSSQTRSSVVTSIVIPNSYKRDLDGVFAHLHQFGRWGMDKRKRFIIANWSWHTVVRIYAKGETIGVTASPRAETMFVFFVFGVIPMYFIASGLTGHGQVASGLGIGEPVVFDTIAGVFTVLGAASGFGIGWLFWWMFLLSNTLEQMQKILVAPTPPKPVYK